MTRDWEEDYAIHKQLIFHFPDGFLPFAELLSHKFSFHRFFLSYLPIILRRLSDCYMFATRMRVQEYMKRYTQHILFSFTFLLVIAVQGQGATKLVQAKDDTSFVENVAIVSHYSSTASSRVVVPTIGLSDFQVVQNFGNIQLTWVDTNNQNTQIFQIQRSIDSLNFQTIGTLDVLDGKSDYGFVDQPEEAGKYYYRIRIVSNYGDVVYSNVIDALHEVQVMFDKIEVFPNPAVNFIKIENMQAKSAVIQIRQLDGAMLLVKNVRNDESVDVTALPRGWVIIRIIDRGQSTFHRVLLR
jgi:hypothetical protein